MKSFVIYGMERTGSSLLVNLLNSHPQIHCEGELFHLGHWRRPFYLLARMWQHHPMPYLIYRQLLMRVAASKAVYGFKLHTKLNGGQVADVPGFLRLWSERGWKVIHLERQSLLDQVISSLVAGQTKRYFGHNGGPEPSMQVTIPEDRLRAALERAAQISQNNRRMLADIPHLVMTYEEDLARNSSWQATVTRVCSFLDLPSTTHVHSRVSKPWSRPYSEFVTNYAELIEMARQNGYDVWRN